MTAATTIDSADAHLHMQAQEAQARSRKLQMPQGPGSPRPVDKEKKLRDACEGFESIFVQKMWEQMRATVPKTGFLHGREEQFWQGMFDQELAKKMTSAGGIGLADMMYDQLSRTLVSSSRTTASALTGKGQDTGFTVSVAPLMGQPTAQATQPVAQATTQPTKKEHDIYAGAALQPQAAPVEQSVEVPTTEHEAEHMPQQRASAQRQTRTTVNTTNISGTGRAQAARQTANTRLAGNAVLPAHMNAPAQAQTIQPSIAPVPVDEAHAPLPPQFVMHTANTPTAQPSQTIPAPGMIAAPPATDATFTTLAPTPAPENPGVVNSTFTTNVPPKRGTTHNRPARVPSGQPLIRTLGGVPAMAPQSEGMEIQSPAG